MKLAIRSLFFIILVVFVSSCQDKASLDSNAKKAFDDLYSDCDMNLAVQFVPPQDEYRSETLVNLGIKNTSIHSVIFPDDLNVKIFSYKSDEKKWVEVKNDAKYVPSTNLYSILEPANSGLRSYLAVLIIPQTSNGLVIDARVVITGNYYKDNEKTNECVGAFVDIKILPATP